MPAVSRGRPAVIQKAMPPAPTAKKTSRRTYLPNETGLENDEYDLQSFGDTIRAHDELRGWRRVLYGGPVTPGK